MKRFILAGILFLIPGICHATSTQIWRSSHTASADTAQKLCNQQNTSRHGILGSVCVNTGAAGSLTIYNSSSTAANIVAVIDTTAKGCNRYEVYTSSGLVYTNSATADVTMMFDCY